MLGLCKTNIIGYSLYNTKLVVSYYEPQFTKKPRCTFNFKKAFNLFTIVIKFYLHSFTFPNNF